MVENAFVGRSQELEHVAGLLRCRRLVTLTGPPGVGKTRLASEVAAGNTEAYFVELTAARDEAAVIEALAAAVRAPQSAGQPPFEAVMSRLRQRDALVVLDNCEHITGCCAALVIELLRGAPMLRLLVTSRQPLEGPAETVVDVRPLTSSDAVALFVDRAALRGVIIHPADAGAVEQICEELDGLPLAVELAAARAGFMTPQEIAARVGDRFDLLKSSHRSPAHHASLLAALRWSYDLLSPGEAALFRRLAVFSGGWTMEAAQAVCAPRETDPDEVLHSLSRLAAHSLVVCTRVAATTRYRYLETVRGFAETNLRESGEEGALRCAHAAWYRRFAETAGSALAGKEQRAWLNQVEAEYPDLRSSLEWCLSVAPADALAIAGSMSMFWLLRGRLTEGRDWLVRALAANVDSPSASLGEALWGVSVLTARLGAFDAAWAAGSEALTLARRAGDPSVTARALYAVGFVSLFRDLPAARPLLEASIAAAEESGDQWCLANALAQLGFAEVFRGDSNAALPLFERSLTASRECEDQPGLRSALLGFGYASLLRGAYGMAAAALNEGLEIARQLDDPFWIAIALTYSSELARSQGEHDQAEYLGEESIAVAAGTDSPLLLGFSLSFSGRAALDAGRVVEARSRFEQAMALPSQAGNAGNVAIALLGLSEVTWVAGEESRAAQLLKEALAMAEESGDRVVLAGALLSAAHRARSLGDAAAAERLAHLALDHGASTAHPPSIADALETLAGLAIDDGRFEYAARLCGAAVRLRRDIGCHPSVPQRRAHGFDLSRLSAAVSPDELDAAWNQGEGLAPEEVCGYARRGRGPRRRPASGLASLSPTERQVMRLASLGLTNAEIGERLFISARTVQTHMAHIFAKLGVTSRRQLVQAAAGHDE